MRREDILAMVPGRELDALIHKHVLQADYPFELAHLRGETRWSEDIGKSWEVMENLQESSDAITLSWSSGSWCCHILTGKKVTLIAHDEEWSYDEYMYDSPSAPEAICKAALLDCIGGDNE